jgi:two-component system, response regulator, stage 0 sporulation protein F
MDKVLIADSDREHLSVIRKGFTDLHHFELLTAVNGKTAIETLQQQKISVVVTDMHLSDMDGVDLIAYMTRNHPSIPCIIMLEPGKPKPWFSNRTGHEDVLYYLEKPFEFGTLASMIFVGLNLRDEGLSKKGIALKNLLPLMELSAKTCRMEVASGSNKNGFFYFHNGVLLDAICNQQTGEEIAREMAGWEGVKITFSELPEKRKHINVSAKLMDIVGAKWKKTAQPAPAPPPEKPSESAGQKPTSKFETALKRYAGVLKTIKGYLGLAILSPDGSVLASDTPGDAVDFKNFAFDFNNMMIHCNKTVRTKGFDQCTGFTVHTKKGIIVMMASDVYKHGNFRFIGLMAPEGNGYFLQVQLEKVIPQILSAA